MSVGISLGQGSMKANLLVMKKRGGEGGGKVLVKRCTRRKHFQHWKLTASQNSSGDLRFSSRDFFVENGFRSMLRVRNSGVPRD